MQIRKIRRFKVFISCPSDIEDERRMVEEVCKQLTETLGPQKDIEIIPIHWEKDVVPVITGEGAQTIINDQIGQHDYDIYIGILWKRFGNKQANGMTPTEEEFKIALDNHQKKKRPIIQFYFKRDEVSIESTEQAQQVLEVCRFRERVRRLGISIDFEGEESFKQKVQEYLPRIIDEFDLRTAAEPEISKTRYSTPEPYLRRTVCPKEYYASGRHYYLWDKYAKDTVDVVSQCKRVAFVGDAGMGKTTELQRIAAHFSRDESPFYPFLVPLNKYVNQSLRECLPSDWEEIPKSKIAVILDGLDEIESKNKRDAIRQIEFFAEQHPETHIVVSCRTNFYESETEQSSGTLSGFSSYVLLELDEKQIRDYIQITLDQEAENFRKDVSNNRLHDLLRIPFYLLRLVELFKKDHTLPRYKAEIFEQLLANRIEQDIEHYRTTITLDKKRETILKTLQRLALGMEILGRNYISNDEYCQIVEDEVSRELIEHCTVWKKDDSEDLKWQFEHNNFQEYLAAKVLSARPLATIKDFMFFAPTHRKLIPSWSNTFSFLISVCDSPDLIQWVMDYEPELIVKCEPDRIDVRTRINLFQQIFNHYKEKQIWINHEKFRHAELAMFGQSDETVEFLLAELEKAEHYTTACNAVELLGHLMIPHEQRNRTCELLVGYAVGDDFGDQVQNRALMTLADLGLNSQDVVAQIVGALRASENEWVRYGLYYFLHKSACLEENIDIFLDGLRYVRYDFSSSRSRLSDEHWHLQRGLEKAKSSNSVTKILKYFAENPKDLTDAVLERSIPVIAENAANACLKEPVLYQISKSLLEALIENHSDKQASQFLVFFDLTDTRCELFKEYLLKEIGDTRLWSIAALVADESCIEFFIGQLEQGRLEDNDVLKFRNCLAWKNSDLYSPFNDLINARTGNRFPLPQERDYERERKERAQSDFDLLFDKEAFLRQIELIYETEGKESLTEKDILDIQGSHWENPYFSNLAIINLRNLAKDTALTRAAAVDAINNWNWDWFCICNVYKKSRNNKDIELTEKQKHWVAQWCYSNLANVDFKTALETKTKTSSSASWPSIFLWHFLRKLNLKYPKEVLLDMISYDWIEGGQHVGIEYLESLVNKHELATRVLQNLGEGIENGDVLKNHFGYCKRHRIREVLPFCQNELTNSDRGEDVRRVALETICDLSPTAENDLEASLSEVSDDFKWNLIEKLVEYDSNVCHEFLLSLLKAPDDEEKLRSAQKLIELQDLEGLKHYVEWIKKHMKSPETVSYHDRSALTHLKIHGAVPYIVELLEVCYQPDFEKTGFDHLEHHVLNTLTAIALQETENYQKVRKAMEDFIEGNTGQLQNVNFLNIFIENLDQKYYVTKSEGLTISDVRAKLGTVFGTSP